VDILNLLRTLGDRLGILEITSARPNQASPKIETRAVTLAELMTEIRSEEIHTLADVPAELSVTFEKVFEAAGIPHPPHGWTVERLKQLLKGDPFRGLEESAIQQKVLENLRAENVDVQEIVKEAIAQDRALDEFEKSVIEKVRLRLEATGRRLGELDARIKDLQAQRASLGEQLKGEHAQWTGWLRKKRAYEKELASAVGYLIDKSVITVDGSDD
jgi:hypothetical protein